MYMSEKWGSKLGFLLASIGSAVGLGNIWRFPYIVGMNGGGAFLAPYLVSLVLLRLPLMIGEVAFGRMFRGSPYTAFNAALSGFKSRLMGLLPATINLAVMSYYVVIMGWVLAYLAQSFFGRYVSFEAFSGTYTPLAFFAVALAATLSINALGVKEGSERLCKVAMPLLVSILFVLLFFSLSTPGVAEGLSFYLTPDLSKVLDPTTWVFASSQALFSLSAGWGILMTYGGYLKGDEDIPGSMVAVALADTSIALLAGFIVFPLTFTYGYSSSTGPSLAFVTLPRIFNSMWMGPALGGLFYLLLSLAALPRRSLGLKWS